MPPEKRLLPLLERWVTEAEAGRLLTPAELCAGEPELVAAAERSIEVLRRFHELARPAASTEVRAEAAVETSPGESVPASATSLPEAGALFGRYRLESELGGGGMGVVYRARDTQLERDVALKVIRPELAGRPGSADRFLLEARAMAALRHDHVVEVYDYGEVAGFRFLAMPLLAGESLATRLARQRPLSVAEVVRVGRELAEGLAAVHGKGLIHRDLKPSNIWLEAPGGRVKLLDFGLARDAATEGRQTCPGAVTGTPAYMSPEQVNGLDLDARSDLFSLGSVLYQTATGRSAFTETTLTATLHAVGNKTLPPANRVNPSVPQELSDLIDRLHRKEPDGRPASAADVAGGLRQLEMHFHMSTAEWPATPPARRPASARWKRARVVGPAFALVLVVASLLYAFTRPKPPVDDHSLAIAPASPPAAPVEPLRVRPPEVYHQEGIDAQRVRPRGVMGKETFGATPDDDVNKVQAHLSHPAYAYLIMFRPDGKDEVLYPQDPDDVPEKTDEPQYPSKSQGKVYGLTDGTGLWVVALVASDRPLPAYAEWRKQHPGGPWAKADGQPNLVLVHDGKSVDAVTPESLHGGTRGQKESPQVTPVVRLVDWRKAETGGEVSAIGFTVEAKK